MIDITEKTQLLGKIVLVKDVSLIQIKTLKAKFLDQIEEWWSKLTIPFDEIEIIGLAHSNMVFRKNDKLWKLHQTKFYEALLYQLVNERERKMIFSDPVASTQLDAKVREFVAKIPQIFVD